MCIRVLRGSPVPVGYRSKRPIGDEWQNLRIDESNVAEFFPEGADLNVGINLEASRIVDVDLDCPEAIDLAPEFLPKTLLFGRPSKPRSHWLYRATDGARHRKFSARLPTEGKAQCLVEHRTTGQTVVPGSVHESGESIRFCNDTEPERASVDDAVRQLAIATYLVRRGWKRLEAVAFAKAPDLSRLDDHDLKQIARWVDPKPGARESAPRPGDPRIEVYNSTHPIDWERYGRTCPICGHNGCFGPLKGNPARWYCFSASHEGAGVEGTTGYHGDSADLAAHEAGLPISAFLASLPELAPLTLARQRMAEFREGTEHSEEAEDRLVSDVRALVELMDDPLDRDRAEVDLQALTGKSKSALALPRVKLARDQTTVPSVVTEYGFDASSSGAPQVNLNNAFKVLKHERRPVRFDQFKQRILTPGGEWSDVEDIRLARYMQEDLGLAKMTPEITRQAVILWSQQNAGDSVREYFDSLQWDGVRRLEDFLFRAFGVQPTEYTRAASRNFMRSVAARVLKPGAKVDTMLVLEGLQGIMKSTGIKTLAGADWFAEAFESPTSKDFFLALIGKLIVEIAEMSSFSKAEVTAVKRVLSCQVDRYRPPYGRASQDFPRRGVFVGTTNADDYLSDPTGGRRFWPVRCTVVDVNYIAANREQLFAEAFADVKAGATWWEMPAGATAAEQEARRAGDAWEDVLRASLEGVAQTTAVEALTVCGLATSHMDKSAQMRVAAILRRLGFGKCDVWADGRNRKVWRRRGGDDATH